MESKKICSACGKIIEEKGLELGGKLYHASCAKKELIRKELIRIEKELTKIEPYIRDLKESWEKGGGRMENIGREALELMAHYVGYQLEKTALKVALRTENARRKIKEIRRSLKESPLTSLSGQEKIDELTQSFQQILEEYEDACSTILHIRKALPPSYTKEKWRKLRRELLGGYD